jgi:hypothetical protein
LDLKKRDLNWDLVFEEPFSRFWTSDSSFARKRCEFWDLVLDEPFLDCGPQILGLQKRDLNWDLVFEEPFFPILDLRSFVRKKEM